MSRPPEQHLKFGRRNSIVRTEASSPAGNCNDARIAMARRRLMIQFILLALSILIVTGWHMARLPNPQGALAKLAVYAGLSSFLCLFISFRPSILHAELGTQKAAVQRQLLAILCAVLGVFFLNDLFSLDDVQLWLVLCSLVIMGTAGFLHAPLAAGNYVGMLLAGTILTKVGFDWPALMMALLAASATCVIARFQSVSFQDSIQKMRQAEERARTAQALLSSFEDGESNWLWKTGRDERLTYVSPHFLVSLGLGGQDLDAMKLADIFRDANLADQRSGLRILEFHMAARLVLRNVLIPFRIDDAVRWLSLSGSPLFNERNEFTGYSGVATDVSDSLPSEHQAGQFALLDPLTGLAHRAHFLDALGEVLDHATQKRSSCALLFIDLDRFKLVNDTLGHPVGDELLRAVARRIEYVIKDKGRAGRLGGDEFVVIIADGADRTALSALTTRIIAELSAPYTINASQIIIGASVGIALGPDNGAAGDDLVRHADLALYAAKEAGRGSYQFYDAEMGDAAETRRALEIDLRDALANDQICLAFQPIFDLKTERLSGFEALLRWNHPRRGFIPPEEFIPIAEESGMISQIGEWVLRTACMNAAQWPDHIRVAVNLSAVQFYNANLASTVMNALASSQIAPSRVELEITESVFLRESLTTRLTLQQLHELGVQLALDDFGTGYSSLGYLRKASFRKIKIDRSFVQGIDSHDGENRAIVRAIVAMADSLGMITTAEGAETQEEVEALREIGCNQIQGFAYGKPMSFESASGLVAALECGVGKTSLEPRKARIAMLRKARIRVGNAEYPAVVRNLSSDGLMMEVKAPLKLGMEIRLAVTNFGELRGTVRWIQASRIGVLLESPIDLGIVKRFSERSGRSNISTVRDNPSPLEATASKSAV